MNIASYCRLLSAAKGWGIEPVSVLHHCRCDLRLCIPIDSQELTLESLGSFTLVRTL